MMESAYRWPSLSLCVLLTTGALLSSLTPLPLPAMAASAEECATMGFAEGLHCDTCQLLLDETKSDGWILAVAYLLHEYVS